MVFNKSHDHRSLQFVGFILWKPQMSIFSFTIMHWCMAKYKISIKNDQSVSQNLPKLITSHCKIDSIVLFSIIAGTVFWITLRTDKQSLHQTDTYSSAGSGAAAAAAAALSPGGGCSVGTAFEDLAGVDVGDTLFVGDPWKVGREAPFLEVHQTWRAKQQYRLVSTCVSPLSETWNSEGEIVSGFAWNK